MLPPGLIFWCAFEENKLDSEYLVSRVDGFEVAQFASPSSRNYDPKIGFYIDVPNNDNSYRSSGNFNHGIGTGDFTFAAWVKNHETTQAFRSVISIGQAFPSLDITVNNNSSNWGLFWGPSSEYVSGTDLPADNAWHHVCIARQGTTLMFWLDGVQTSTTHTVSTNMTNRVLSIGEDGFGGEARADIADVRIYNRFYTGLEVMTHWAASRKRYGFPLGLFDVAAGGVTVTPSPASAATATVAPTVVQGSLSVTPTPVSAPAATIAPNVVLGALSITPGAVQAAGATVDPSVIAGALSVTPNPAQGVAATIDPAVVLGALLLTPNPAQATAATVDPTVLLGGLSLTPDSSQCRYSHHRTHCHSGAALADPHSRAGSSRDNCADGDSGVSVLDA